MISGNALRRKSSPEAPSLKALLNEKKGNFYMEFEDYCRLPKLRVIVSEEVAKTIEEYDLISGEKSWNKSRYKLGRRALPIRLLLKSKEATMQVMKSKPKFLTHGGVQVMLPTKINEDLAYLCGLVCGDGNLFISEKRDYILTVHNIETALLDKAVEILEREFSYTTRIKQGHYCLKVEVRSEVIHSFFNKILEIESGRKENIVIPKKIKADKKLTRAFIAGFFDAEGNVALQKNKMTCQISIAQKQKGILEEISRALEEDTIPTKFIKSLNHCWCLYGNKASLAPFLEKIPFIHPKKREKLETAVRNQAIWQSQRVSSDAARSQAVCSLSSTI